MNIKKLWSPGLLSLVCVALTIFLFLLLCWTAAADAQGAIALFLYAPVLVLLLVTAFFLGRRSVKTEPRGPGFYGKRLSQFLAVFILLFYISPMIGLGAFSNGVIEVVAKSFEMVTGKSPMAWNKNL